MPSLNQSHIILCCSFKKFKRVSHTMHNDTKRNEGRGTLSPLNKAEGITRNARNERQVKALGSSHMAKTVKPRDKKALGKFCVCVSATWLQSWPTLCDPMDCSSPGSSVHRILQARILEWVGMPSFRASSQPRDQTCVSYISCIGSRVLYH